MPHLTPARRTVPLCLAVLLALIGCALCSQAQENVPAQYGEHPRHAAQVQADYQANAKRFAGNKDVLVLPGLVARRTTSQVQLQAEATGIEAGTVLEFLLVAAGSDKGYESLFWSHARPSDLHRALEFIGLPAGKNYQPREHRYWAKGERVQIHASQADGKRVALQDYIQDKQHHATTAGFVFSGSTYIGTDQGKTPQYAADVVAPRSLVSLYNDPTTVLDVSRRAEQQEVYGSQLVAAKYKFAKHALVTLTFEADRKDNRHRVLELALDVQNADAVPKGQLAVQFHLRQDNPDNETVSGLANILRRLAEHRDQQRDPFVSVRFAPTLSLSKIRSVCQFLSVIDADNGIRVEPPATGQLYYRAFLPDQRLLDHTRRLVDPWELHVEHSSGDKLTGKLIRHESDVHNDKRDSTVTSHTIRSQDELKQYLQDDRAQRRREGRRPPPSTFVVFVTGQIELQQFVHLIQPALDTHRVLHVFLQDTGSPQPPSPLLHRDPNP